jgi:RecG-like helicase
MGEHLQLMVKNDSFEKFENGFEISENDLQVRKNGKMRHGKMVYVQFDEFD